MLGYERREIVKKEEKKRILGRLLAKDLTDEQLKKVAGGSVSFSGGEADDGDPAF